MTRAKKPETVAVRLSCIYSGADRAWSPGDVIEVDAAEAERLRALGVAEIIEA